MREQLLLLAWRTEGRCRGRLAPWRSSSRRPTRSTASLSYAFRVWCGGGSGVPFWRRNSSRSLRILTVTPREPAGTPGDRRADTINVADRRDNMALATEALLPALSEPDW